MMVFLLTTPAAAQDYMATGSYVGDGTTVRSITDIGFAPDLVIVKNTKGDPSMARTATMPEGFSANLGEGQPLEAKGILSLDPDGFTIDDDNAVNDADVPFFWVAMKSGTGHVRLGSFEGDGNSYHPINGLGFQPAVVILISDTSKPAILRTDTMPPGFSVPLRGDGPLTDGILNLYDGGFVVGLNDAVNLAGITMHYIAWPAADQTTVTGLYSGNDNDNRTISGIGLDPEYMIVRARENEEGVHRMASVTGDTTLFFRNNNFKDDLIQAFVPNGFVLGTGSEVNQVDRDYNWIAFANPPERTDLDLQMGADNAAPNAGETVTFDLVLTNLGPVDATGVLVQVPVPSGFTFQSAVPGPGSYNPGTGDWTIGNLAVGGEANLSLTLRINAGTGGQTLSLNALASAASPPESDLENNEVSIDINVTTTDLVLSALVNDTSPDAGNTVVYTIAVTNAGLDDGTGITVSGSLPTGLVFLSATPSEGTYNDLTGIWDLGTLPALQTETLNILARVNDGTGGQVLTVPFAVTSADQEDPDSSNNSRPVTITVTSSDLGLVKTVDDAAPEEGAIVNFRIVATNTGPSHATGIVVSDMLPAGLSFVSATADSGLYNDTTGFWAIGSLTAGSSAILDLRAVVGPGTGGQTLTNTASVVEADQEDPDPDNNTASALVVISGTDLSLQMGADNAAPNAGETVTFDLVLTNNGPVDATGVLVQAPLQSGFTFQSAVPGQGSYNSGTGFWTIGDMAVGAETNLSLTLLVNTGTGGRTLNMSAVASATTPQEIDPDNNQVSIDITVPTTDLILSALVNDASPDVGNTLVYTVAITNAGLDDGTGIAVSGNLPVGLVFLSATPSQGTYNDLTGHWALGTLAAPQTATMTILARVDDGTGGQNLSVPFAVVSADQEDPDPSNNSRPVTVTVTSSDLGLVKTVDTSSPDEGAVINFQIVASNAGPSHATGIVISDELPVGLSFVSATADFGLYNDTTGLWTIDSLPVGSAAVLDLRAVVALGTGGQTLINTASIVEADQDDLVPDNNSASAGVVVSSTDLQLEKTVNTASPNEGDTITYTVTITNGGPIDATNVEVTDLIPAGLGFVSDTPSSGTYNSGSGIWGVGNLAAGDSETLQLSATVDPGTAGTTITNVASISGTDQADPVPENDSSSVSVTVSSTDLQLTKNVDNAAPNEGETVVYTVTLTNVGPNDANGVEVTDVLPAGLLFQSADPGPGSYDAPSGLWTVGPVTDGQTVTLTLTTLIGPGTAGTLISNTAAITASDLADPDLDNNQDSADLTVSSTDLNVTKTVNETEPSVGSTVIYTVKVTNDGPNEATGVTVSDLLPGGLTLQVISESQGSYDSASGLWTVGTIADGVTATLTLTVTIDAAAAGNNILNVAAVASVDQADMNPDNDEDSVGIDVQPDVVTPIVTLQALEGAAAVVWPGGAPHTVLRFALANRGNQADTLRSLTISNLTTGFDAPHQAALDAEWNSLTIRGQRRGFSGSFPEMTLPDVSFTAGQAILGGFSWVIDPGDTLEVWVESAPSLVSRDGAVLTAGIVAAEDIGVRQTLVPDNPLPLLSGHELVVDGLVADQVSVVNVPSGTLAVGTTRSLAFVFDIPANGYLADSLYGLSLNNRGNALPVADISVMEAWIDNGDGSFDEAVDELLGTIVHSGELWQLTGLDAPVPTTGRRIFVTVDLAFDAIPGREISLELSVEHGSAVIMASGNDGPLDRSLVNGGVLAITVADRLVLTTENIDPETTRPGTSNVPLLTVNIANTYGVEQRLETLTVRNGTQTDPAATLAERDAVFQQVILRLDGNGDGMIGDFLTDPALGSGAFVDGTITFTGLDLPLVAGDFERVFITADVSLGATADGDVLGAFIASADDIWAPGTSTVAAWPLDSGAAWQVDGMVAAQITSTAVDGRTMGPGEGPEAALDLWLPANGYLPDRLVGVSVLNDGTAEPGDLAQVNLWADDGDGVFEGSVEDLSLGMMNWLNGRWVSPVLSHDIPVGGARFFVSVNAAVAPTDSATIRFSVPIDGVVMASFNSGPIDADVPAVSSLVLSTSALVGRIDFDTPATTTGQPGVLRMTVRNVSGELVTGITPTLNVLEGDAVLAVGSPVPASFDLLPDGIGEFAYNYTATAAGTIVMTGSSAGLGDVTGLDHIAVPSPSEEHRVHSAVPRLDTYPTDSLPANVARGQQDLSPLTLTLVNPGDQDVAVARLDSFRIRLSETESGPAIIPADLIESFTLIEGSNVYVTDDVLPISGDEFVLRLSPPALITGSEPVTLGLRLDLRLDSTMPSFVMTIDGSGSFDAHDAVSGLPVPVSLGGGTFPIMTKQANLVSNAGGLAVTAAPDTTRSVEPAQTDVVVAALTVRNDTVDPSASSIRIQALGFTPRRTDGAAAPDPSVYFDYLEISSPSQVHFMGLPQVSDSLVVMLFSPPLEVPVGANVQLTLSGDLKADTPLGALRFDFENLGQWLVEDAGDGSDVVVSVIPTEPVTGFTVVAPVTELQASGSGALPATLGRGSRDMTALELKLVHPGGPGTAAAAWDSLNLQLLDETRDPLNPAGLIDRVRVFRDDVVVGSLADPADPGGHLALGLSPEILAAGDTVDLVVRLDLSTTAPLGSFELITTAEGVVVRDTVSGLRPDLEATGIWPVWSGLATIVVASEEISLSGESLMPALLAPQTELDPVLQLTLANTASVGSGPLAVSGFTLLPAASDNDFAAPGAAVATLAVAHEGIELGRDDSIPAEATTLTMTLSEPLLVPAGESRVVELLVGIRAGAPKGRLRLELEADGIAVGPPGSPPGGIRVVPAAGQSLPLVTEVGNIGQASLADSYINFPNPFAAGREQTTFAYFLRDQASVTLRLLTPHGGSVATILNGAARSAGLHQEDTWSGENGNGIVVRNGVFIAELVVEFSDGTRERILRKVAVVR